MGFGMLAHWPTWPLGGRHRSSSLARRDRAYEALIDRLAGELYRRALAEGGWATEIGGLGPSLFRREATTLADAIALGDAGGGPPPP
jgi:hypothetical protein